MTKRSYGQYCGLAQALDVVGSRWSLLIVRELLGGPARYGQLQAGLPGIATNLLAERLRELEEAGVVRRQLDTDSNSVAYALTPWGNEPSRCDRCAGYMVIASFCLSVWF